MARMLRYFCAPNLPNGRKIWPNSTKWRGVSIGELEPFREYINIIMSGAFLFFLRGRGRGETSTLLCCRGFYFFLGRREGGGETSTLLCCGGFLVSFYGGQTSIGWRRGNVLCGT